MIKRESSSDEMKLFMEKVGLDVFQFILSFLPPVPYLFQLQRVSKHYALLCQSCMEEDCSELYWDEEAISQMTDHIKKLSSSKQIGYDSCLEKLLKNVKSSQVPWILFFREILHKFKKLDRLVLKNMDFNIAIMYIIFADWKGSVKELKIIECDFQVQIPCNFTIMPHGQVLNFQITYALVESFVDCSLMMELPEVSSICNSPSVTKIEKIKIVTRSTLAYPPTGYEMIPFVKLFPSLKNVFCPIFRTKTPQWSSAMLLFPDIVFEPLLKELADNEPNIGEFYMNYLCNQFNLRKNRLELIIKSFISGKTSEVIHNFFGPIINFLEVHAPFGLDSLVKDVRGNNIIQLAILFTNYEVVRFFVRYLTALEDRKQATKDLSQLFSENNRFDGRNAIFKCVSSATYSTLYFQLLLEYGVSFNFPDKDGNTILHTLCEFGQLSKLQTLWNTVLNDVPPKEKKYYLDFNVKNKKGQTPLHVCKLRNMPFMVSHLQTQAELYGIEDKDPLITTQPARTGTNTTTSNCKIM